jgi:hypothetical protein
VNALPEWARDTQGNWVFKVLVIVAMTLAISTALMGVLVNMFWGIWPS